ncbi:MAG: hypothetical protein JXR51_14030 [Bacteroidales bacterium]|nr:hypothetical protein [Bacteroidales bacterium]MBN2758287.1 hypothetical protein [Bacteroidales bacterium]
MENLDENAQTQTPESNANDDKVIGILSYLGILWVVAYIIYGNKKTDYNLFHLKQGLGLFIVIIVLMIIGSLLVIRWFSWIFYIAYLVFAIMGIISAANGEQKPLPIIGKFFADTLKNFK